MGRLIEFYGETGRARRPDAPGAGRMASRGGLRVAASFAAVGLALALLMAVQQMQASEAAPAFFSMLFPQLVPQGLLDLLRGGACGAVPL